MPAADKKALSLMLVAAGANIDAKVKTFDTVLLFDRTLSTTWSTYVRKVSTGLSHLLHISNFRVILFSLLVSRE